MLTRRVPGSEALGATKRVSLLTSVSRRAKSKCGSAGLLSFFTKNVFLRLVKKLALKSDVILENFKPGSEYRSQDIREQLRLTALALEKWSLGPADLHPLNPNIILRV